MKESNVISVRLPKTEIDIVNQHCQSTGIKRTDFVLHAIRNQLNSQSFPASDRLTQQLTIEVQRLLFNALSSQSEIGCKGGDREGTPLVKLDDAPRAL